jgi:predicted O-methyltransferase YrrM
MNERRINKAKVLLRRIQWNVQFPPGSYYSPIPSVTEVRRREDSLFASRRELPGIDLREIEQLALINEFANYYPDFPFTDESTPPHRYYLNNRFFGYGDGVILYSIMRHVRPTRVVEIGSGFSSALMLDVNEQFLDNQIEFTFVDPNTERLDSLLSVADRRNHRIIKRNVQEIEESGDLFGGLGSGDVLFIDSSHVSKVGSDVNFLMLEVLPRLSSGVIVHVHDIFDSFEYPKEWVMNGRAWNEAYLLRALLTSSTAFEIMIFNAFLKAFHRQEVSALLPLWEPRLAGSLWLKKA